MDAGINRVAPGLENVHKAVAQVVNGGANENLATYEMRAPSRTGLVAWD